jgi:magnesium transporter
MKIKDYFTPKSFVYSGEHQNKQTIIRHFHYNDKEIFETDNFEILPDYKSYIQVIGLNDIDKIKVLNDKLQIEEVIFEDIFSVTQREKIEIRDKYLFAIVHALFLKDKLFKKEYFSILCLENLIISFHEDEPWFLETTINALNNYQELRKKTSDFLFYHLLDLITDNHIDLFDQLSLKTSHFEEITLNEQILPQEEFYRIRKAYIRLKNNVSLLVEPLNILLKNNHELINKENIEYFLDLIDHLTRLDGHINLARENLRNLVDVNINNQSNRMNKIMTTLTLFSAIFIPLSFLTGFFGMNFVHFEILEYRHAVIIFVGICILLIGFMIWLFKRKDWL